jgi:hypothetical protein
MFFQDTLLDLFLTHFVRLYVKKIDFGTPSKSSWGANAIQNHPSGAQNVDKFLVMRRLRAVMLPTGFLKAVKYAQSVRF